MNRLQALVGASAVCLALATTPANAGSSRVTNFQFPCDGSNKQVNLSLPGFAPGSQFILGGEIILYENNGGLQYVVLIGEANLQKTIVSLGKADNSARIALPTFFQVTADGSGNVIITVAGACNAGAGQVQGRATIYFN